MTLPRGLSEDSQIAISRRINEELVAMVKTKAEEEFGLGVSVLNCVDHTDADLCECN